MRVCKALSALLVVVGVLAFSASPALANHIDTGTATITCSQYTLTVCGSELFDTGVMFVVNYDITLTPSSGTPIEIKGSLNLQPNADGTACATIPNAPINPGSGTFAVTGTATLAEVATDGSGSVQTDNTIGISFDNATLRCGTPPQGKSFSIGPSSMEGSLFIHPGDWVNGGYNFKFTSGSHGATAYSVTATVTVPVTCSDSSIQNIVVPLGAPGQLNGGGVTTFTYNIAAGDTTNHASGDQNSILVWEGAVQAPADLCSGAGGRNQKGAVFSATVSQSPQVGLVDWQFHYRDPAAKGKPNTNCTDASDPNRNRADVCGASWSQTVRDP